jgi:hypothetical protein
MTLRPEYALGHSQYNPFLFASVGEEKTGQPLTVLTALARLGFDPWTEAARLSDLPRETATRVFAVTIAMLPEGDWKASDSEAIAARLVNWLPGRSIPVVPSLAIPSRPSPSRPVVPSRRRASSFKGEEMKARFAAALTWGVIAIALVFLVMHLQDDHNLEPPLTTDGPSDQSG